MDELGEVVLREVMLAIVNTMLLAHNYSLFALDDGWQGPRLANGSITASAKGFPSGMAALSAFATTLGLRLGIYTDRGTVS